MSENHEDGKTSREAFLNAKLGDFRYEQNPVPNEYRLYHCTKYGMNRFALCFCGHKKIGEGPWFIEVYLNEVNVSPNRILVYAVDEKLQRHVVPDSVSDQSQRDVLQKVCEILDAHPVNKSVVP